MLMRCLRVYACFEVVKTIGELLDVTSRKLALFHAIAATMRLILTTIDLSSLETYPLLGPLFIGCRLKQHRAPVRLQLEQASGPFSEVASQRIYRCLAPCV